MVWLGDRTVTAVPLCFGRRHRWDGAGCLVTFIFGYYGFDGPSPRPLLRLPPQLNAVVALSPSVLGPIAGEQAPSTPSPTAGDVKIFVGLMGRTLLSAF